MLDFLFPGTDVVGIVTFIIPIILAGIMLFLYFTDIFDGRAGAICLLYGILSGIIFLVMMSYVYGDGSEEKFIPNVHSLKVIYFIFLIFNILVVCIIIILYFLSHLRDRKYKKIESLKKKEKYLRYLIDRLKEIPQVDSPMRRETIEAVVETVTELKEEFISLEKVPKKSKDVTVLNKYDFLELHCAIICTECNLGPQRIDVLKEHLTNYLGGI